MNTVINNVLSNDDELYNRVIALGPGDGINRWQVVVEDATSISDYGVREVTEEFPTAVDLSDLTDKASTFLAEHKDPAQEISATYYFSTEVDGDDSNGISYDGELILYGGEVLSYGTDVSTSGSMNEVRRGDTVRIVSRDLGQAFTGVVQELDWQPGQVTLMIGQPAYNLLDVINGPEEDEERKKVALGLPTPIGFVAYTTFPGVTVRLNPYTNSRAVGVEVYGSQSSGFGVSRSNLLARGPGTQFYFPDLDADTLYYFRARAYDLDGNVSDLTDEVSALSGSIEVSDGSVDIAKFAADIRPPRFVDPLPDVTLVPTDWELGDIVVLTSTFKLYKLEDTTGNPSIDWVPIVNADDFEGELTAANIAAGTITANEIAGNTITAAEVAAGAIGANEIAAGAIVAGKLAVGDFSNAVLNSGIEDDDISMYKLRYPSRGQIYVAIATGGANNGSQYLGYVQTESGTSSQQIGIGGYPWSPLGNISAKDGDRFHFEFAYKDGPTAPTGNVKLYAQQRDRNGSFVDDCPISNLVGVDSSGNITSRSTAWRTVSAEVHVDNPDTAYVWFNVFFVTMNQSESAFMDDFVIRRKSNGQLLVDGEITADKLSAGSVTTGKLSAGHIIIDDGAGGDGDADRLRVNTTSGGGGTDQVVLGDISGLSGVPSGTDWGLWGALGTGIFMGGAPRMEYFSAVDDYVQNWPISSSPPVGGSAEYTSTYDLATGLSIEAPSGWDLEAIFLLQKVKFSVRESDVPAITYGKLTPEQWDVSVRLRRSSDGVWTRFISGGVLYDGVRLAMQSRVRLDSSISSTWDNIQFTFSGSVMIVSYDPL